MPKSHESINEDFGLLSSIQRDLLNEIQGSKQPKITHETLKKPSHIVQNTTLLTEEVKNIILLFPDPFALAVISWTKHMKFVVNTHFQEMRVIEVQDLRLPDHHSDTQEMIQVLKQAMPFLKNQDPQNVQGTRQVMRQVFDKIDSVMSDIGTRICQLLVNPGATSPERDYILKESQTLLARVAPDLEVPCESLRDCLLTLSDGDVFKERAVYLLRMLAQCPLDPENERKLQDITSLLHSAEERCFPSAVMADRIFKSLEVDCSEKVVCLLLALSIGRPKLKGITLS